MIKIIAIIVIILITILLLKKWSNRGNVLIYNKDSMVKNIQYDNNNVKLSINNNHNNSICFIEFYKKNRRHHIHVNNDIVDGKNRDSSNNNYDNYKPGEIKHIGTNLIGIFFNKTNSNHSYILIIDLPENRLPEIYATNNLNISEMRNKIDITKKGTYVDKNGALIFKTVLVWNTPYGMVPLIALPKKYNISAH